MDSVDAPAGQKPYAGYAICCSPRAGSTYLCELLSSTGLLGRPYEHLTFGLQTKSSLPEQASDRPGPLARVLNDGATANGIYGLKIFPFEFDAQDGTAGIQRLPGLRYVFLTRRDLLGQALSFVRASQTSQWRREHASMSVGHYDRKAILRSLAALSESEARWRMFFARNAIEPLRLDYEDVVARPQAAVDAVAALLGLSEPAQIDWNRVGLKVQRDDDSSLWRQQFLEEEGDPGKLDSLEPPLLRFFRLVARRLDKFFPGRSH